MVGPPIPSRMEQPANLARQWVGRGDVCSFISIAQNTSECQVVGSGRTAVLPAHYMIHLVREAGVIFTDKAVFTTMTGAPSYFTSEWSADVTGH
jgi:hypothetical protein